MTPNEFLQDYLGYLKGDNTDPTTLNILASLVDLNKDQSLFDMKELLQNLLVDFSIDRNHHNGIC
jgi:hypothetical protein